MTLAALKLILQTVGTSGIGEVIFDWKIEPTKRTEMNYPYLVWSFDGAKFSEDYRSDIIQKVKLWTLPLYAVARYDQDMDKIAVWDTLESQVKSYLNTLNATSIEVVNINKVSGQYAGEGLISPNSEIGMMISDIQLKSFC